MGLQDFGAGWLAARGSRERRLAKRIVVYGGGEHGSRFIIEAPRGTLGEMLSSAAISTTAAETLRGHDRSASRWLGNSQQLIDYVREEKIDEIVIALPWSADQRILEILRRLRHLPVPIRLAPDMICLQHHWRCAPIADRRCHARLFAIGRVSEWNLLVKSLFDRICRLGLAAPADADAGQWSPV